MMSWQHLLQRTEERDTQEQTETDKVVPVNPFYKILLGIMTSIP